MRTDVRIELTNVMTSCRTSLLEAAMVEPAWESAVMGVGFRAALARRETRNSPASRRLFSAIDYAASSQVRPYLGDERGTTRLVAESWEIETRRLGPKRGIPVAIYRTPGQSMPLNIHHSVIHGFAKEPRKDIAQVVKKNCLLDSTLPGVISLVEGLSALLGKKENNQVWGRFGADGREGPFPAALTDYVDAGVEGGVDAARFLALSHLVVDQVTQQAAAEPLSTGGHILCAIYDTEAGETVVIVAMIKQKGGVLLDDNYVPIGIVEVDMSKLHQAAQIRVSDFLQVSAKEIAAKAAGDDSVPDDVYLSFLSQRASRDSSGYFITALGCVVGLSSTKATGKLFDAVDSYFSSRAEIAAHRKQAKERLSEYLQGRLAVQEPATLDGVTEELIRIVPGDKAAHVKDLQEFLNSDKFKVPDHFEINADVVKRYSKVVLQNDRISIKFDRGMLGSDANATLFFDKTAKTLTYRNLPDDFLVRLENALKGA